MQPLPHHMPLLGPGASLTDGKEIYEHQQQALQAAQEILPTGLHDHSGPVAPRALVHAVVDAYLKGMRGNGADVTTTIADGVTVYFEPSGVEISTCRRDPDRGPGLFVQIDTGGIGEKDMHPGGSPKLAVFVNDTTVYDTAIHPEPVVWLADGVNGPVVLAHEGDARAYCAAHGMDEPEPLLVADRQTAADLIGETA